jgi:integrase
MPRNPTQTASLYTRAGRRKYLTHAERQRFLDAAQRCPRFEVRMLCLTLAYTGCRISEALELTRPALEAEAGFIAFRTLKRRLHTVIIREVPVPQYLLADLIRMHGNVLPSRLWPYSRSQAWRLVKAVMREAGIADGPHASPKGLRHGFGVHAIRSGVPLHLVQRWLGHASMTTTAIYLQVIGDEERAIAKRMWRETDHAAIIVP